MAAQVATRAMPAATTIGITVRTPNAAARAGDSLVPAQTGTHHNGGEGPSTPTQLPLVQAAQAKRPIKALRVGLLAPRRFRRLTKKDNRCRRLPGRRLTPTCGDWTDRKNRTPRPGGPPNAGEGTRNKRRMAKARRRGPVDEDE